MIRMERMRISVWDMIMKMCAEDSAEAEPDRRELRPEAEILITELAKSPGRKNPGLI